MTIIIYGVQAVCDVVIRNLKQLVIINLGGQIALFAHKMSPIFVYKIKTLNLFRLSVVVVRIAVLRGYSFT